MSEQQVQTADRPRLLFVDDEKRVLNSMRIMFRRQFDLFLASHGAEALEIIKTQDIDVIIADHRMPQMTGVEVLTKVRSISPRTVRILLTGYADLDAVEGSINDAEVFRFLTKPCAPDQLRETVTLAAKLARETPVAGEAAPPPANTNKPLNEESVEIILESDTASTSGSVAALDPLATSVIEQPPSIASPAEPERQPASTPSPAPRPNSAVTPSPAPVSRERLAQGLGVIVFSADEGMINTVQQAVRGRLPVYGASNIVQVVKLLSDRRPGVLVTDISDDKATIQSMTARLKSHLPELVTIAVSQHRDVLDMVWLINHGQIFRFLRKPLSAGRCAISLQAALKHHRMLLKNPELVKRYETDSSEDSSLVEGLLNKIKSVRRLWASG